MITLNGELQLNTYGSEIASKGFTATGGRSFHNNIWIYAYSKSIDTLSLVITGLLQCNALVIITELQASYHYRIKC